ncbi:MAG: UDP-N-acetylmuramate--L-alanine ligase [Deltaproteobacteria bacterium]|nr:UDP-N-acetylmuramate--L-alanine ligase [Deltaproteobacteria bacterium]
MFKKYQHIHMVGIGGIGMSGIAEVLLTLGYRVSGSDVKSTDVTRRLKKLGAKISLGHKAKNVGDAHVVVISSAINDQNPEVLEAEKLHVPVVPRAEMLAELMRLKFGVAISGTHGKTSTTAMIGTVLHYAGLDPTLVIGGKVNSFKTNAKLGKGEVLVAEADESDRSFLKLQPAISVITNIDAEHMEQYKTMDALTQAFVDFANKVPFYGAIVACADHPVVRALLPRFRRRVVTYGTKNADYMVRNITQDAERISGDVWFRDEVLGRIEIEAPGKHYALNALACVAVARELDVPFPIIAEGFRTFQGVGRRFELLHRGNPIVVDDYGHHPVEIAATIQAARDGWPHRRLVVVMQPHRYSRLNALFDDFVNCLTAADVVLIMDVYAAGEKPLPGCTGEKLWRHLKKICPEKEILFRPTAKDVLTTLTTLQQPEDLILFLGAGDVTKLARDFSKTLTSRSSRLGNGRDSSALEMKSA